MTGHTEISNLFVDSIESLIFALASRKLEGTTVRLLAGDLWVPLYFYIHL